jgi:thiol-disulfide isomerase/thioredoxin
MIDIRLAGGTIASLPATAKTKTAAKLLPDVELAGLDGKAFRFSALRGKPVLIEFWAPWCPHCLTTLAWMKKLDPSKVTIVPVAIESPREDVVRAVEKLAIPGRVVMGSTEVREAFGGPRPSRRSSSPTAAARSCGSSTAHRRPCTPTSSASWRSWPGNRRRPGTGVRSTA